MKCKECGSDLLCCKTSNQRRYRCLNVDCPVLFARRKWNNGKKEWEWVYEAQSREEPL